MIILASRQKRAIGEIGKVVIFNRNGRREVHKQPYINIRETTYEEWIENCVANGCNRSELPKNRNQFFYYEVISD